MPDCSIGLAVIARDEQHNLPRLLDSLQGAFDHVALVDTGSTDGTVELFTGWCEQTGQAHTVDTFEWADDFAAARNHADALLHTDWTCWADADDEIVNAQTLRRHAGDAPESVQALLAVHAHLTGAMIPRERLVRRGAGRWVGRVHERQQINGTHPGRDDPRLKFMRDVVWLHGRTDWAGSTERNRRIYSRWIAEAPDDPELATHLRTQQAIRGGVRMAGCC